MKTQKNRRIESIDIVRGVIMVVMALDHSRAFLDFNGLFTVSGSISGMPYSVFFTRLITHLCAPGFVFLAGTGIYLFDSKQNSRKITAKYLLSRGLWLIFIEISVVNFIWGINFKFDHITLQVIWVIGLSMILMSFLIFLPKYLNLIIGFILIAGHNFFDNFIFSGNSFSEILWYILHQKSTFTIGSNLSISIAYPFAPWLGVMILGYYFGALFKSEVKFEKRKKIILALCAISILLFLILRYFNLFGYFHEWELQESIGRSVVSFFNTNKYPPSFLFLLMTLGPLLFLLVWFEGKKNKITEILIIFGSVPFLYYILHLYFLKFFSIALKSILNNFIFLEGGIKANLSYDWNLFLVYIFWILTVVLLYPICAFYKDYKKTNKDKWWLTYL